MPTRVSSWSSVVLWQPKAWCDRPIALEWAKLVFKKVIDADSAAGVCESEDSYLLIQDTSTRRSSQSTSTSSRSFRPTTTRCRRTTRTRRSLSTTGWVVQSRSSWGKRRHPFGMRFEMRCQSGWAQSGHSPRPESKRSRGGRERSDQRSTCCRTCCGLPLAQGFC